MSDLAWRHAPPPSVTDHHRSPFATALLAVLIALIGPLAWSHGAPGSATGTIAVVGVAALLAAFRLERAAWVPRLAVALVAGAVVAAGPGLVPIVGLWLAAGVLLAHWSLTNTRPLPFLPQPGPSTVAPVTVLAIVAAVSAYGDHSWARIAIPFGLACAVPVLSTLGGGTMARLGTKLGDGAATVVSTVLFSILGVFLVFIPWLLQRPLRIDPLHPTRTWGLRTRRRPQAAAPWAPEAAMARRSLASQLRSTVVVLAVALAAVWATPAGREAIQNATDRGTETANPFKLAPADSKLENPLELKEPVPPDTKEHVVDPFKGDRYASLEDSPWFYTRDYSWAQGWALEPRVGWRAVNPYRILDFRSSYVNVVDGHRLSWTPPPCDCTRLKVWIYGGSTTYGLDQRDEHTIPSELARVAKEQGITLDVENRGELGFLHWMEAERFAWDLTVDDPPDLVLFYDGVNDGWATNALNDRESGDIKSILDPTTIDVWNSTKRSDGPVPDGPDGSKFLGYPKEPAMESEEMAATIVQRYDRSRQMSRATAEQHGIPIRYIWQPTRVSRPLVDEEPHGDAQGENYLRLAQQLIRFNLPDDVIDVSDALDGTRKPLFSDDVHHNEYGAQLVAKAIYANIESDLQRILKQKEAGR